MGDSPIPMPRKRLASSSGAMAAVKPEAMAKAVDALETDMAHVRTVLKIHTSRLDSGAADLESQGANWKAKWDRLYGMVESLRAEVATLNLNLARAEGQASALKWAVTLIPTGISLAALMWSLFGRR